MELRNDLPPLTKRLECLPIDPERGYPVPFFTAWIKDGKRVHPGTGTPDFRITDPVALNACVGLGLCWCCGQKLGVHRTYVVGPMCVINRASAEPPSHNDCAEWSVMGGCPFLSRPKMVRREIEDDLKVHIAGHMIGRNPGVMVLWQVEDRLRMIEVPDGSGYLFNIGEPTRVRWYKEGRPATNEECIEAIDTGIQNLLDLCETPEERNEVAEKRNRLVATLQQATIISP